jgi:hypothetical protein
LERRGWELSGLQKTTSYEFEGRWAGDSSRSAYLFFHKPEFSEGVGIDAFLDETSRGLKGTLSLVLEGPDLSELPDPGTALAELTAVAKNRLPPGYRTPLTLRYRLSGPGEDPSLADTEIRFKILFPQNAMKSGFSAVSALASAGAGAFEEILRAPGLAPYRPEGEAGREEDE